ncbi:F390 synthetase-related protein [Vibrio nigripulchritudo]|uniref:F390 synthetase-related protein n=1 Tax=Vibrio nigripulchritudo TaxID=28173 RepID=UPI0003B1C685|nr:F390 synthetase-related protein [Vibrio nigripulchritudo]CCN69975.1 putative Coenzyme F390 synthetase [Vibrio nigripulchritudo SFn118]
MITILRHYVQARYPKFKSREQVEEWQQNRLQRHLNWVCDNSPLYLPLKGLPLDAFPVINKSFMMENLSKINTERLKGEDLMSRALEAESSRQFNQSKVGNITVGLSSGTSGQRGLFLANSHERQMWAGNILGKLLPNIWQKHRIALALRANSPLYSTINRGPIQFYFADLMKPTDEWIKELDEFQPTLLVGSAQALQLCAEFSGTFGLPAMNPQRIISGAEVLTPSDRAFIENRFNADLHEVYQCTEGFLGCTDNNGQMRWNQDIVYIEKHWLNKEKTHYSPIITDFRRRTQPVIRYQLDDIIEAKEDEGIFEPIGAIAGRSGDKLLLPRNSMPTPVLPDLIYRAVTLNCCERVDYRITQSARSEVTIECDSKWHEAICNSLKQLFLTLQLDEVNFKFDAPPDWTPANKQRRVVNQYV